MERTVVRIRLFQRAPGCRGRDCGQGLWCRCDEDAGGIRRQLAQLGGRPEIDAWQAEADRLREVLDAVAADNLRRYEQQPPDWLVDMLGAPPERLDVHAVWREAATRIEAFRVRWQIEDPDHALGQPPVSATQDRDRSDLVAHLRVAVRRTTRLETPDRERGQVRQRSISLGIGR